MNIVGILLLFLWSILVYLAFPGGPFPLLTWVAFVPFGISIATLTKRHAIVWVTTFSIITWIICVGWIGIGIRNIGRIDEVKAGAIALIPVINTSLPYIVFCFLAKRFSIFNSDKPKPFAASALLTLIISTFPNYFPVNIAHSLYKETSFIQICDLGGVTLLLLIVNTVNFLIVSAILTIHNRKTSITYATMALLIFCSVYIYGSYRLFQWEQIFSHSQKIKVGLIQPNIPFLLDNKPYYVKGSSERNSLETLIQQTLTLARDNLDIELFVWPEIPLSLDFKSEAPYASELNKLLLKIKKPIVVNGIRLIPNERRIFQLYNVIHLIQNDLSNIQTYFKNHLVPLAEYNPLEKLMKLLGKGYMRYSAGKEISVFEIAENTKIGTPVCLEAIYPNFIEGFIKKGASVIINPSNDAYFGYSRGAEVHLAVSSFRAVEYRIPLVRAANSGISQVVDQKGHFKISDQSLFTEHSWAIEIPITNLNKKQDPNLFGMLLVTIVLVNFLFKRIRANLREH